MKLLVDTSAILALVMRDEAQHQAAVSFAKASGRTRLVLTDLVVAEVATRLRARAGAAQAVVVARDLLASQRYEVLFVDPDLFAGALGWMERHGDKRLSLTDCASFEVMRRLGLTTAFTFDRDFRDCGFETLP